MGKSVQVTSGVDTVEVTEGSRGTSKSAGLNDVTTAIAISRLGISGPLAIVESISISSLR